MLSPPSISGFIINSACLAKKQKTGYNYSIMKANVHPQYFEAQVICACGNRFTVGSTKEEIHIELCNKCHPFYTGEQRFVDSASRIQKFQNRQKVAQQYVVKKTKKIEEKKKQDQGPKTLREMLMSIK